MAAIRALVFIFLVSNCWASPFDRPNHLRLELPVSSLITFFKENSADSVSQSGAMMGLQFPSALVFDIDGRLMLVSNPNDLDDKKLELTGAADMGDKLAILLSDAVNKDEGSSTALDEALPTIVIVRVEFDGCADCGHELLSIKRLLGSNINNWNVVDVQIVP